MRIDAVSVFSGRAMRLEVDGPEIARAVEIAPRAGLPFVAPGFIDLQVNGYQGMDYSSPSFGEDELERMIGALAVSGTTTHLPTIITAPQERIIRNLSLLARARRASSQIERAVPGYHVEGPFISREDGARGAHDLAFVRDAEWEEFRRWQEAAEGRIKIVTLAPEVPGALELTGRLAAEGVLVSIGHTAASPAVIRAAIAAGASLSTHLGNGSHAMLPRLRNYLWEQIAADELTAGIISDGYHLPQAVVRTIVRTKGLDRLFLVSDVAVHGGARPGVYPWGANRVEVFADGHLGLEGTGFLAGAGHLLDHDIARLMQSVGPLLADAVRLCTVNPGRLIGERDREEFLREGAPADLAFFFYARGSDRLEITRTIQAGRELYHDPRGD